MIGGCGGEITGEVEVVTVRYQRTDTTVPRISPAGSGPGWNIALTELVLSETSDSLNTVACPASSPDADEVTCAIGLRTIDGKALARIISIFTAESGATLATYYIPGNIQVQYGTFQGTVRGKPPQTMNTHIARYGMSWWAQLD
jgi:hypothetical protein